VGDSGAAVVEFAIILPILVLLLFGIVEFSVAYNRSQAISAAAREGARYGSLPVSTVAQIKSQVTVAFAGVTFDSTPVITVGVADGGALGDTVQPCDPTDVQFTGKVFVQATATESIAIPLMGAKNITLTGKGVFQCEPTPS
jgi:Flp pilus assembly protein TadG